MSQDNSTTRMSPLFYKIDFTNSKLDDVLFDKIHHRHVRIRPLLLEPQKLFQQITGLGTTVTQTRSSLALKKKKKKLVELEELAL